MKLVLCQIRGCYPQFDFRYFKDGKELFEKPYGSTPAEVIKVENGVVYIEILEEKRL